MDLKPQAGCAFSPTFTSILLCPSLVLYTLVCLLFSIVFSLPLSFLLLHAFFSVHLFLFSRFVLCLNSMLPLFSLPSSSLFHFYFFLPVSVCFIIFCSPFCLLFLLVFTNIFPLIFLFFVAFFSSTPLFLYLPFLHS